MSDIGLPVPSADFTDVHPPARPARDSVCVVVIGAIIAALLSTEDRTGSRGGLTDNARRRAVLARTALPLLGRYADDDGPLDRTPPLPAPQGNRRQRRAHAAQR